MNAAEQELKSHFINRAYSHCTKNIRNDLSANEKSILLHIKSLMNCLEREGGHVFCCGNYPCYLEGTLKTYNSAFSIIYTCSIGEWDLILEPRDYLDIFYAEADILSRKEDNLTFRNGRKMNRLKCEINFGADNKLTVDVAKFTTSKVNLQETILDILSLINIKFWKVALYSNCETLFRWGTIRIEPKDEVFKHLISSFGNPASLTWQCAKRLNII